MLGPAHWEDVDIATSRAVRVACSDSRACAKQAAVNTHWGAWGAAVDGAGQPVLTSAGPKCD